MPQFRDLIKDINDFLENPEAELSEDGLQELLANLEATFRDAFGGRKKNYSNKEPKLVASNLGLPPRRLWYALKTLKEDRTPLTGPSRLNFLYGSIIENLIICLAKETGHYVTEEQKRVEIDGVSGKKDCRIDGMVTDVKSASSFSFRKFNTGEFLLGDDTNDPFGYKYQIGFYMMEDNDKEGAFLVVNKENGQLTSVILDAAFDVPDVSKRIDEAKAVLERDTPPDEKCYPEVPRGKSGNHVLHRLCSFCDFKYQCWKDANDGKGLIEHKYSDGMAYFTRLVKEPQVRSEERTDQTKNKNDGAEESNAGEPAATHS